MSPQQQPIIAGIESIATANEIAGIESIATVNEIAEIESSTN